MEEFGEILAELEERLRQATHLVAKLRDLLSQSSISPSDQKKGLMEGEDLIVIGAEEEEAREQVVEVSEAVNRNELLLPIAELAARTPGLFGQKESRQLAQAAEHDWKETEEENLEYARTVWICAAVRCRLALAETKPLLRLDELLKKALSGLGGGYSIILDREGDKAIFKAIPVYDESSEGAVVAVVEPAVIRNSELVKAGKTAVSVGRSHPVSKAVVGAIKALSTVSPETEAASHDLYFHLRQFHKWWLGMPLEMKPEHEQARLRDILNTIDLLIWRHHFKSPALKSCSQAILEILKQMGFKEIYVPIGRRFDESLSPGKFEREFVKSDSPPGTIVGVIRRGFVDSSGTTVQKVLVAVSR